MEYHQDSFLAGIAVGRRLKGWACGGDLALNMGNTGNAGGGEGIIRVGVFNTARTFTGALISPQIYTGEVAIKE
nr:hypothetical protein [uncultured Dysosmobacter sp.]